MTCWRLSISVCTLVLSAMTLTNSAWGQIGQIKTLTGEVHILRHDVRLPAKAGDLLERADTLTTEANSSVGITFIDGSRFSVGPNSSIELEKFVFNPTTHDGEFLTKIKRGTLAITSGHIAKRSPDAMKVKTRKAILGVRGTNFLVKVQE